MSPPGGGDSWKWSDAENQSKPQASAKRQRRRISSSGPPMWPMWTPKVMLMPGTLGQYETPVKGGRLPGDGRHAAAARHDLRGRLRALPLGDPARLQHRRGRVRPPRGRPRARGADPRGRRRARERAHVRRVPRALEPARARARRGPTGPPTGPPHAHRPLPGHLPGVEFYHEFCPQPGDRFWTPADWAWVGGLLDVLLPAWHYGLPVVAHRPKRFDAERCLEMLARHRVRNTFLVPTMLKMMRAWGDPRARFDVRLRTLFTGGEAAGEEVIRWSRECLGVTPNEGYGQTEVNLVLGNCSAIMEVRPGSMGRPIPGHAVDVLDDAGRPVPAGEIGEVAVRRPDPVMFLGYWRNEPATREKFVGDWALTGDLARRDADGYFWFVGRKDDLISSGGYPSGPGGGEGGLGRHPARALRAASR